jgi:hypothetical protein
MWDPSGHLPGPPHANPLGSRGMGVDTVVTAAPTGPWLEPPTREGVSS